MWKPDIGVCSWSLQATSVPELARLAKEVGADLVQVGLGDPTHGGWEEGDRFPEALGAARLRLSAAMIGYPGEDYSTPETIRRTGGFGDVAARGERLDTFRRAVDRTRDLGLDVIQSHAGFIPEDGPERDGFLECLAEAGRYAASKGVIFAMETGQETAELLRRTLDELSIGSLKVNFDPANMILYGMGDPIEAIAILGPDIVHVHAKDARPPQKAGEWGAEVPLGEGDVGMAEFVEALEKAGYTGPLVVEREVGDQAQRVRDIRKGIGVLRRVLEARTGR